MKNLNYKIAGLSVIAVALCGCAATTPVKDVLADPDAYMATFGTLPAEALAKLPQGEAPVSFRRIELKYKIHETRTSGRDAPGRPELTLTRVLTPGAAAGVVRQYDVYANNGVTYRYNFKVT